MLPTHHPGDLVVVRPVAPMRLQVGDVVVVRDPRDPSRETVKRIAALPHDLADLAGEVRAVPSGMFAVSGDNPAESTDSRRYGPVAAGGIVGRVVWACPTRRRRVG
jgi:signal peptidase I